MVVGNLAEEFVQGTKKRWVVQSSKTDNPYSLQNRGEQQTDSSLLKPIFNIFN